MAITEDAGQRGAPAQFRNQFAREARHRAWEISPVEGDRDAGEFPVPRRRVLASGYFRSAAAAAFGGARRKPGRHTSGCQSAGFAETEACEVRKLERSLAAVGVRFALGANLGDVPHGIGAVVAI